MKTLYLDLVSGISGDMFLGALLDLGVDGEQLQRQLKLLPLEGYHIHIARGERGSIAGVKFDVHLEGDQDHEHHGHTHSHDHSGRHSHSHQSHSDSHGHGERERNFAEIRRLIGQSGLSPWVKERAAGIFERIAVAEGKIHGLPPEQVHFHEVGAVDSIIDILGGCIGLELLGKPRLLAGEVVEGNGWVDCAHGRFPIPAPATLAILGARGIPLSQCSEPHEMVTPTGAALLAELVEQFGPMQNLVAEKIGFGLGSRELKNRPNVLRAILGTSTNQDSAHDWETDTVAVLETNLDDINPEVLGHFVGQALNAGALDLFYIPVQMKKNRPGVLLTLVCSEAEADKFSAMILQETSTFGVRRYVAQRRKLHREFCSVRTAFGEVRVKIGRLNGRVMQAAPEFESCKAVSEQAKVPIKTVYDAALKALQPT
jgi:uncharacterized protein (TIGR00299 family) protein